MCNLFVVKDEIILQPLLLCAWAFVQLWSQSVSSTHCRQRQRSQKAFRQEAPV